MRRRGQFHPATVSAACGAAVRNDTVGLQVSDSALTAAVNRVDNISAETTLPVINPIPNVTANLPGGSVTSLVVNFPLPTASDNCGIVNVTTSPISGSVFPLGVTTVNVMATDAAGNTANSSFTVTVLYYFTGFFQPVGNLPTINIINAGQAIPMKFSVNGNQGLNILSAGYPISTPVACDASEPGSTADETVNAGSSSLSDNATTDQCSYVWKTNKAWKGTCRMFVLKLNDGSEHYAKSRF